THAAAAATAINRTFRMFPFSASEQKQRLLFRYFLEIEPGNLAEIVDRFECAVLLPIGHNFLRFRSRDFQHALDFDRRRFVDVYWLGGGGPKMAGQIIQNGL